MSRKKVEVVELNKKEEKIVLEEKQSALILFLRRHRLLIFLTLLILSLTAIVVGILLNIKNFKHSEEPTIKQVSIDTTLDDYIANVSVDSNAIDEDSAKNAFNKNNIFKSKGEVILTEVIEHSSYTIKFYSDGTAIKILKGSNKITRISALKNGKYGIRKDGVIDSNATISDVKITKTKDYPWGKVTYYSDGSAEVSNSKMDIFVRDAKDINDNYISDNKVTYIKETKNIGNIKLIYYYDGTIEVIKNNKSYLVRTEDDLNISSNDVTFKNNNEATIISSKKLSDGKTIDYYEDGGATIRDGEKTLSVRKSNSIVIKDNKVFEIVDSIYVEVSKKTNQATYYTNGGAVVNYNGQNYYVEENSNIKYNNNNNISTISGDKENLSKETNMYNENVKTFEKTAVITTKDYIAIIPSDKVVYDENGKIKDIDSIDADKDDDNNSFKITNNTNGTLKYRVVIEQSPRTNLDVQYIRYMFSTKNTTSSPARLDSSIWKEDNISKSLNVKGINYILIDSTIEPHDTESISVMLWTDYDTIPNAMQDKYFYGTIRLYAWQED